MCVWGGLVLTSMFIWYPACWRTSEVKVYAGKAFALIWCWGWISQLCRCHMLLLSAHTLITHRFIGSGRYRARRLTECCLELSNVIKYCLVYLDNFNHSSYLFPFFKSLYPFYTPIKTRDIKKLAYREWEWLLTSSWAAFIKTREVITPLLGQKIFFRVVLSHLECLDSHNNICHNSIGKAIYR